VNSGSRRPADDTGESAVGDLAGDSLLAEILWRIDDKTDRILILGRIGLEMSDRYLSSALNIDKAVLTARVAEIMSEFREDREMAAKLSDLRRAGRVENYLALALRLGLEDWFCAACGLFMVQPERGRRRRTCSSRCRVRLSRSNGKSVTSGSAHPAAPAAFVPASDELLRRLMRPVDGCERPMVLKDSGPRWWDPATRLRDRAILLLGFTCDAGLTSADIVALDIDDIVRKADGLELRLYRTAARQTRYVTVPVRDGESICPVAATLAWKRHLATAGHRAGPMFVRLNAAGRPADPVTRLSGRTVAAMVERAARLSFDTSKYDFLTASRPVRSFVAYGLSR